jgi:hypothetical protein
MLTQCIISKADHRAWYERNNKDEAKALKKKVKKLKAHTAWVEVRTDVC